MKQRAFLGIALAASITALTIPNLAQAQTKIGELQRTRGTTVSGRVTSVVGNNFVIQDDTGQIIVDAGPRWWREINLSPGERVTVTGELGKNELDAFSITRANGSRVEIRSPEGPPPWAGGPNRDRQNSPENRPRQR